MTDKQIIETLRNIKKYCNDNVCSDCKFCTRSEANNCLIQNVTSILSDVPETWNMEEIERITNEVD